jgi:hypothetical protein
MIGVRHESRDGPTTYCAFRSNLVAELYVAELYARRLPKSDRVVWCGLPDIEDPPKRYLTDPRARAYAVELMQALEVEKADYFAAAVGHVAEYMAKLMEDRAAS